MTPISAIEARAITQWLHDAEKAKASLIERRERALKQLSEKEAEVHATGNELGVVSIFIEICEAELDGRDMKQRGEPLDPDPEPQPSKADPRPPHRINPSYSSAAETEAAE